MFGWRVGGKPDSLLFDELGGGFAEIANGLQSQFAGDVVGFVVCGRFEGCGPTLGGAQELGESLAEVAVGWAVVVEVIVELVGNVSELFEEIVDVLFASRLARTVSEGFDGLRALVQKLDEDEDAIAGDVGGVAKLLNFGIGERSRFALGVQGREKKQKESEGEDAGYQWLKTWLRSSLSTWVSCLSVASMVPRSSKEALRT